MTLPVPRRKALFLSMQPADARPFDGSHLRRYETFQATFKENSKHGIFTTFADIQIKRTLPNS